jgi:L-aspartate oxidase
MRHVKGVDLQHRFPGITTFLTQHGLSLATDLIPVRPAAHYLMGGVRTDLDGRASMPGLYAAGETACTGVHGANRLASNSLLEGLVFGARAGEAMRNAPAFAGPEEEDAAAEAALGKAASPAMEQAELRQKMWEQAGLLRNATGLKEMQQWLTEKIDSLPDGTSREEVEARNMHDVASLIVRSSLAREESRGAHFRTDFPARDDARFQKHSVIRGQAIEFVKTL